MVDRVLGKIAEWRRQLLDLSKRNRLINCRVGPRGVLLLEHPGTDAIWDHLVVGNGLMRFPLKSRLVPPPAGLTKAISGRTLFDGVAADSENQTTPAAVEWQPEFEECVSSRRIGEHDILTRQTDRQLQTRLRRLSFSARSSLDEQGVNILFAAFGMLTWYESPDSDVAFNAPLLLVPVTLSQRGPEAEFELCEYEDEVIANLCVREMLSEMFHCKLPEFTDDQIEKPGGRRAYFDEVLRVVQGDEGRKRWSINDQVVLGTFSFQKVPMWQDLGKNAEEIARHPLCRAMAGDAAFSSGGVGDIPGPRELDARVHPNEVHTILDCDSSQLQAVVAAQRGASLVVDGPPGTGKSQTIANLIAEFLAAGKTVLFVSEKSAALEVVKRRLDQCRLGDFCLALHSHQANKKEVIAELGRCLALPNERHKDQSADLDRLKASRERLNHYVQTLHLPRAGLGLAPFVVHGRLAALGIGSISDCPLPDVLNLATSTVQDIEYRLELLTNCRAVIDEYSCHPWSGCRATGFSLTLEDELRRTLSGLKEALVATTEPLQVLRRFRLIGEHSSRTQVQTVSQSVRPLLESPSLSETWFAEPRVLSNAVQKLHEVSSAYRTTLESLPPFDQESWKADLGERLAVALRLRREDRARAPSLPEEPLRTRTSLWQDFQDNIAKLREKVIDVQSRMDDFIRALRVKLDRDSPFRLLKRMGELGQYLAQTGRVLESWFDDAVRKELRRAAVKCQAQIAAIQPIRERLQPRWSAEAFEPVAASLIEDALKLDSFWKRLFGGWGQVKRQLLELRSEPLGSVASVFADLRRLRDFQQQQAKVAGLEIEHAADLLRAPGNRVDWSATAAGLEEVESLRAQVRIPDRLKQVMAMPGMLDRDELGRASVALSGALNALELTFEKLKGDVSFGKLVPFASGWVELNVTKLLAQIDETATTVSSTIESFESVLELLPEDADLTLGDLDRSVRQLPRLSAMREEARVAAASVTALVDVEHSPELLDWSDYAAFAQSLSTFQNVCGNEPLESFAKLGSDPDLKRSLEQALAKLDETLAGGFQSHWKTLGHLFAYSSSVSTGVILDQLNLSELQDWVTARLADLPRLLEWLTFRETEQALSELGVATVLSEILASKFPVDDAAQAFLRRLYRVWLDAVYQADPVLRGFQVAEHERLLQEFRELDRQSVAGAPHRIRGRLLNSSERPRANQLNAPPSSELGILTREVEKKRRHLPLRLLFKNVPTLTRRLKPCFMMSPLAVSTFLDEAGFRFDVVIFDEASQVHPHDAIGAVYRGQQLIVAGDQKQLPPTKFFERMVNDDSFGDFENDSEDSAETTSNLSDFESVLDVCCSVGLPRQRLRWHYRSRREPLIAFSNRHFYDSELVTFPSVLDAAESTAVTLHHVPDGRWQSGKSGGFNAGEARATVELIRQHAIDHPGQSLGVITLNLRQQLAVLDELDELQRRHPELIPIFSQDRDEPFFVKNLENVQGDERDRIILSVGYGFDQTGKFAMRFGPLNTQGGERRLNVAVTRAKHQVTVVSSIHAQDIDLSRTSAVGVRLLRAYLEFAERGVAAFGAEVTEANARGADSEFEESVEAALIAHGFRVHRQVGCSGYRIDLALTHPNQTGRYVLGVECDGASYHSSATARDRDRLRQSVLEQLGWKLIRVWSTDWIRDPSRQVARIEAAFNAAMQAVNEEELKPNGAQMQVVAKTSSQPTAHQSSDNEHQVVPRAQTNSYRPRYEDIDAVPSPVLRNTLLDSLRRFGQTPKPELITAVSRELGFGRTGPRIQERIENEFMQLKLSGDVIETSDGCRIK